MAITQSVAKIPKKYTNIKQLDFTDHIAPSSHTLHIKYFFIILHAFVETTPSQKCTMWHSYCCYGNYNIKFSDFCTHVLRYNAAFMYCLVIIFLFPHQSSMDYFLTRGRLLSQLNFCPFQSKREFHCQLRGGGGETFQPRSLLQTHLLRIMA